MSTSVKEGISLDETISAVTPVPLEKGDTAKMSPTKHVHIQAAAPLPRKMGRPEVGEPPDCLGLDTDGSSGKQYTHPKMTIESSDFEVPKS